MAPQQAQVRERRSHLRFDKVFTIYLSTEGGLSRGIGRNISAQGLFVETREHLSLGERVKVTFAADVHFDFGCWWRASA